MNGVGRVKLGGTVTRQIQIRVDSARLIALGLTVEQVVAALKAANVAVAVGSVANRSAEAIVRVDGRISQPKDFGRIIVARRNGVPILLSQIAEVVDGEQERTSLARINGQQSVMVWTGSSGTTYFTVNGKSLGHLGPSGVSETWLFSPSGPPKQTQHP